MALGRESISLEDIPFLAEVAITSSHEVDNDLPDGSLNDGPEPNLVSIKQRLYTSHFLSTWNSRVFEFGAVLFLANLFPDTLLYSSVYALGRAASAICFSPSIGSYMDRTERLKAVRFSIVGQRLTVVLSSVVLWVMSIESILHYKWLKLFLFGIVCSLACVEKLCAVLNMIAVERDWVIVIAENTECELETLDCQMRRIDLFCKLVGPLAIALVDGFSTRVAIWTVMILSGTSVLVEYFTIAKVSCCELRIPVPTPLTQTQVYRQVPALQAPRPDRSGDNEVHQPSSKGGLVSTLRSVYRSIRAYAHHKLFLPSMALALLYLTVLSFSGQMITYLLSTGMTSFQIGILRTATVGLEMSATWLAPLASHKVGPVRAGLWSISWQTTAIIGAVSFFWVAPDPLVAAGCLVAGVAVSRIGLWGFDLSVQVLVQEVFSTVYTPISHRPRT